MILELLLHHLFTHHRGKERQSLGRGSAVTVGFVVMMSPAVVVVVVTAIYVAVVVVVARPDAPPPVVPHDC